MMTRKLSPWKILTFDLLSCPGAIRFKIGRASTSNRIFKKKRKLSNGRSPETSSRHNPSKNSNFSLHIEALIASSAYNCQYRALFQTGKFWKKVEDRVLTHQKNSLRLLRSRPDRVGEDDVQVDLPPLHVARLSPSYKRTRHKKAQPKAGQNLKDVKLNLEFTHVSNRVSFKCSRRFKPIFIDVCV